MTICCPAEQHCPPCKGGVPPLPDSDCTALLADLPGWYRQDYWIEKTYCFAGHHEAMAFANAIAWVSQREDHHPELSVGYRDVRVRYWTHTIGALSERDFICAAQVEKLADFPG